VHRSKRSVSMSQEKLCTESTRAGKIRSREARTKEAATTTEEVGPTQEEGKERGSNERGENTGSFPPTRLCSP